MCDKCQRISGPPLPPPHPQVFFDSPVLSLGGIHTRIGPPSSVVLKTTYVDERVRLGRGSRGSLFVFTRGGAADEAGERGWVGSRVARGAAGRQGAAGGGGRAEHKAREHTLSMTCMLLSGSRAQQSPLGGMKCMLLAHSCPAPMLCPPLRLLELNPKLLTKVFD